MDQLSDYRKRLACLLADLAVEEGLQKTSIEGVELFRTSQPVQRVPIVYQPRILIVGQGRKRAFLGGETYQYDAYNYLVLSVPLPAECEAEASPEEPVLLLAINAEPTMVGELMLEIDEPAPVSQSTPRGITSTLLNQDMAEAVIRLLKCLKCPSDSHILGRQSVREIVYRVLQGEQGRALRAMASRDDNFARIAKVLKQLHAEYATQFSMEELARNAGMSVAAFHRCFKQVTTCSPLQYIKRIRLDHAKQLMAHEGHNASTASRAVGYDSPSQFSREFKRLYGVTPSLDAENSKTRLVGG